jgi:enoyl-CoA hydratase/carnithine racemase
VEAYHALHPDAGAKSWYPDALGRMEEADGQQLYVNAEHDGSVGVIAISRESYNSDVDAELNRAIDWLKSEGIERLIVTGDFHLSTQMVGADTSEFFPALSDPASGTAIATTWSRTARRLNSEFDVSVGFPNGKRCLGGMLELMMHCHYLVCAEDTQLGMPEVTLPVVPGMEGCHWSFRKAGSEHWPKLLQLLLTGRAVAARDSVGWLVDFAGPVSDALQVAWKVATKGDHGLRGRKLHEGALKDVPSDGRLPESGSAATDAARRAIINCVQGSCGVPLGDALAAQAKHSAEFMSSPHCQKGRIGAEAARVLNV